MLLRRFAKHIKDQNWFAVGLDVLVVIVGIFLGMQVSDWNDQINEREEEKILQDRLSLDVDTSSRSIERSLSRIELALENQRGAAELILDNGVNAENIAKFYELRKSFDVLFSIRADTGTLNEIFSSGKIVILRNTELRKSLNSHRMLVESTKSWTQTYRGEAGKLITQLQFIAPIDFREDKTAFLLPNKELNKNRLEIFNTMKVIIDLNNIQLRFIKSHQRSLDNLKGHFTIPRDKSS